MRKGLIILLTTLMLSGTALADVVVIGHPDGPDSLTRDQVRDLFLNRAQSLPDGQSAVPFELAEGHTTRQSFHSAVTGRNDAQLKSFWSQQVFTGRGQPPQEHGSVAAMISAVGSTPGAIGYAPASEVDDSVQILLQP